MYGAYTIVHEVANCTMAQRLCSCLQWRYWLAGKMPRLNKKLHTRQLIVAVLTLLWIQITIYTDQ